MKNFKILFLFFSALTISCSYDNDDNIEPDILFSTQQEITTDSELFENLELITTDDTRHDKNITCLNFKYPLTIFVFDDNDQFLSSNPISDDESFSSLLENVDEEHSISISFPITSTLDSGEELTINTKEELKETIDNCLGEELVFECNQLLQSCVFKVGYSYTFENPYLGAIFQEANGFTSFNYDEEIFSGSWTTLLIENELHININLINDNSDVSDFFNFDWTVSYLDSNSLSLVNGEREIVLNQRCDDTFSECTNFVFEVCENDENSGVADFILDHYSACIFDTLELDATLDLSFHQTEDDAIDGLNQISSSEIYNNPSSNHIVYVRIDDPDNNTEYIIQITLSAISC